MKHYIIYYQEYEQDTKLIAICHTRVDAEELLLSIVEQNAYEDFLYSYIGRPCIENPIEAYLENWKNKTKWRNEFVEEYCKNSYPLSVEGFTLYDLATDYFIAEVEEY